MRPPLALLLMVIVMVGCTTVPVTLRHPDGRVVRCGPYPDSGYVAMASAMRESQCLADFQRQGYERVAE